MKLTKNEISFLSNQILENNKIGFFSNVNYNLDGTEESTLKQKGIYKDGKISEKDYEILKIVAKPEKCTRLILKDKEFLVEKYAYKSKNTVVLAENDNGDMIFDTLDSFNNIILELSEFTGMSNIKTSDIDVLLSDDEMFVMLAIVDIYRKKTMHNYWGQVEEYIAGLAEIREMIDNPIQNGLLKMLVNNYNYSVPKIEIIEKILEKLVARKIVEFSNAYTLTKEYEAFAINFLIPETVVMLETFNINEKEEIAIAGILCVCAGLHDVVSFVFMDGEIQITSITGSYMLKIIENFLNCPNILEE